MPKKIRTHTKSKIPFILIVGEDDRSAGAVSFRFRDGSQRNGVPREEAMALIEQTIAQKAHA
jgi:threonyl-tRNA synthetase